MDSSTRAVAVPKMKPWSRMNAYRPDLLMVGMDAAAGDLDAGEFFAAGC